jgi:hypothetical protein
MDGRLAGELWTLLLHLGQEGPLILRGFDIRLEHGAR